MMRGYARVSTVEQDTALQLDAFARAGVTDIAQEKRSSVARRPVLEALLASLKSGDVLVVYKVDRLARSLSDLLRILDRLRAVGASFRSLTEAIDTETPSGRLMMQMLGAVAEFERNIIRERSIAGQAAAYSRGALMGRPRALSPDQETEVYYLVRSQGRSMLSVAREYGVHLSSVKRVILRIDLPGSPAVIRKEWPRHLQLARQARTGTANGGR